MRRIDIVAVVVLLLGIGLSAVLDRGEPQSRRPDAGSVEQAPIEDPGTLPAESEADPVIVMEIGRKAASVTGTAFSVAPGVWLTADHVTESCRATYIRDGGRYLPVSRVVAHGAADVAVVYTDRSGPALALSDHLDRGQNGYHIGFPAGAPGDVVSSLVGRARVSVVGPRSRIEPALVWAEYRRFPPSIGTLGGISGGPVIDGDGRVVGVTIGGSERRGTVLSAAPGSMREVLQKARARAEPADVDRRGAPAPHRLTAFGNELRRELTVAQVYCEMAVIPRRPSAGR